MLTFRRKPSRGLSAVLAALAVAAAPAHAAVITGMSDQGTEFMTDPLFAAIDVTHVRLLVPWDAGLSPGWWDAWLMRAHAARWDVLVAFDHSAGVSCPGPSCSAPSTARYRRAVGALIGRYPWIAELEPWNEPNHDTQPTFRNPALAAAYYTAARQVCPSCTVVAGDMLDDAELQNYLLAYEAALPVHPPVWGLHNYYDSTYFGTSGEDTMLTHTTGRLWLTETGWLVAFGTLPYDPTRAGQSVQWLYATAAQRPRLARMYLYQWRADAADAFDSGLLSAGGSPRPSYLVLARQVGPRPGAPAWLLRSNPVFGAAGAGATRRLGWSGAGSRSAATEGSWTVRLSGKHPVRLMQPSRLCVALACVASSHRRCSGTLRATVAGRLARVRFSIWRNSAAAIELVIDGRAWAALGRAGRGARVRLALCAGLRCTPARAFTVER